MADTVIYEFDAWAEGVEEWSTNPGEMVDGVETDYASTTTDGDIQKLIDNECVGEDLGTISKVEIRAYAYSDADDQLILRPVFGGTDDGDDHVEAPGVTAGWKAWQDITGDTNAPIIKQGLISGDTSTETVNGASWLAQTFTTSGGYSITGVKMYGRKVLSPGDLTISIRATSDGKPTGGDLATGTVLEADLPTENAWIICDFETPYALSASTMYAMVVRAPSGDISNYVAWRLRGENAYPDGSRVYSTTSGATWQTPSATIDLLFQTVGAWLWTDIQNLDCDVEQNDISKGNTMYVGMVQIQVTYTAEGPPEGVAVQMMHYMRMRR